MFYILKGYFYLSAKTTSKISFCVREHKRAFFSQYKKLLENIKSNPFLNFILKSKQKSRPKNLSSATYATWSYTF